MWLSLTTRGRMKDGICLLNDKMEERREERGEDDELTK
jgi:hypothetical protein